MTITAAIFSGDDFHGAQTYKELPRLGDYIQIKLQKSLAFEVRRVIFLSSNSEDWDVVLQMHPTDSAGKPTVDAFYKAYSEVRYERMTQKRQQYQDRKMVKEPTPPWQRRKDIYERVVAGESVEAVAAELGIKVARVKHLKSDWEHLLNRIILYGDEPQPPPARS